MPYRLVLAVYNSAGERVKQLYDGGVSAWPGNSVVNPAVVGDWGSEARLQLLGSGQFPDSRTSIAWDGTNEQDQPVANGAYWFKLEIHGDNDFVTAINKGVVVLRPDRGVKLGVFNGAGEIIAELGLPLDVIPDSITLDESSGSQAVLRYQSASGPGQVVWNGLNRDGLRVANGSYLIRSQGQGSAKTLAFTLLRGPVDGGQLRVAPNPANRSVNALRLDFKVPTGAVSAHARLYSLAGELIRERAIAASAGTLWLEVHGLAGGIYVVVLEVDGAEAYRQVQKVALVH